MQLSAPRTRRVASTVASTVAVVATAVGLAATPVLHADAGTGRDATSLSIRAVKDAVRPGGTDTVTGALIVKGAGTPAGRSVTLEARPMGTAMFTPVGTATARDHGGLGLTVMPDVTTAYRWHYAGDTDARPSHSGVVRVRVRTPHHPAHRISTNLSIRAVHRRVGLNGADVVRGHLRAGRVPLPHRRVVLVSRVAGADGWTFEGVHRTHRLGVVAFRVSPSADTAYRLVFLGTPLLQPARSGVVRVVVRHHTSLSIRGRATATDFVVSGALRGGGHPLKGRLVTLQSQAPGSADWTDAGTARTARQGVVRFHEPPAPGTGYRLAYAGGPRFAPSTSGTVVS